ncbi:MAG: diphthine--ammonia ligase [Armatimonadetes bacterium]|nr:diphthine--ammonia ligase [Armatimonadota bacterium]
MNRQPACLSWSGGKDSMLALWKARQNGFDVRVLLSMLEENGERNRSHAIPRALLEQQAQAIGAELMTRAASWADYERQFSEALCELRERGITDAIFGDIDLQAHRDWEEKVCAASGFTAHLPLWNIERRAAVAQFLELGFRATVICVDHRWLDASFCGREFDASFLRDLPASVDWCGENGEFHTFVFDGPLFARAVRFEIAEIYDYQLPEPFGAARFSYARLKESG